MGWLDKKKAKDGSSLAKDYSDGMAGALYQDVIEYGRTVHAELSDILGAARRGTKIEGSTLYSTTFPCHECARNIVAAGIKKVIYIHPYSKSRVESLFNDSIIVDGEHVPPKDSNRNIPEPIEFVPFVGISPNRYQSLFDATDVPRKKDGKPIQWDGRKESPKGEEMMKAYSRRFREQPELDGFMKEMQLKGLFPTKEARRVKKRLASKAK
jgi:tRNA(Arg) A34 adenosine deaminase TadA